jgi:DNA-binding beta-propeller fold protein YncE
VVYTVPLGERSSSPAPIVFSPNGARAYVVGVGPGVTVLDTDTGEPIDTLLADLNSGVADMALSPNGDRLYVVSDGLNTAVGLVLVVSTTGGAVMDSIVFDDYVNAVGVRPDGQSVYLAMNLVGVVEVETATYTPTDTIADPSAHGPIAFSADGAFAYVGADGLLAIETATRTVTDTLVPGFVGAISLAPQGDRGYVVVDGRLTVFALADGQVLATLDVGGVGLTGTGFTSLAVTPDGAVVYGGGDDVVHVIATSDFTITASIPFTGRLSDPAWVAINR